MYKNEVNPLYKIVAIALMSKGNLQMKILCVLDSFYPKIDGPAIGLNNIATILNTNHIAQLDLLVPSYPKYKDKSPYKIIRCKSMPATEGYRASLPHFHLSLNRTLRKQNYDLIHIRSPFTLGKYALKFGKKHNIPVISTVHTAYDSDFERKLNSKFLRKFMMNYITKTINKSDYVFTVSKGFARSLRSKIYHCPKRVGVIRNATEYQDQDLSVEIEKLKEKHNIKNEFLFLFVGRVVENKNIQFSLECLKKLKELGFSNFKFLIVGEGDYVNKLKSIAEKYDIKEKVIFTGVVRDRKLLGAYYKMSHLFLFPSTFDTCGIVALEAGSFGLPSMMITDSCASELIEDDKNGFALPENSDIWANKIYEIVKSKKITPRMKEYTKKSLHRSWHNVAIEYFNLYKNVVFVHSLKNAKCKRLFQNSSKLKSNKKLTGTYHLNKVLI